MSPPHLAFTLKKTSLADVLITEILLSTDTLNKTTKYEAVWDTGATNTVVTKRVIDELKLEGKEIDQVLVRGVNSESKQNVYIIKYLVLPNKVFFENISVICSEIGGGADILIGMDLITLGDFAITNYGNKTQFTFSIPPHKNKIDFVDRANSLNKSKR